MYLPKIPFIIRDNIDYKLLWFKTFIEKIFNPRIPSCPIWITTCLAKFLIRLHYKVSLKNLLSGMIVPSLNLCTASFLIASHSLSLIASLACCRHFRKRVLFSGLLKLSDALCMSLISVSTILSFISGSTTAITRESMCFVHTNPVIKALLSLGRYIALIIIFFLVILLLSLIRPHQNHSHKP